MQLYPEDRLYEEVAFVAYHFGWGHDEVLSMPHFERQRWCEEISNINDRINRTSGESTSSSDTGTGGITLENPDPWAE